MSPPPPQPDLFADWRLLADWLVEHSVEIATAAGIGLILVVVLLGARSLGCRLLGGPAAPGWRGIAAGILARTNLFFIATAAAKLVSLQTILPGRVQNAIDILFVIAAAFQAAVWFRALVIGSIEARVGAGEPHSTLGTAMGLIRALVTVAAFLIAIIVILDNVGVDVTGLVAGLGIGGIAIGLAAQGIFKDLFAALAIIFDKPFRKGDTINVGGGANGFTGTVEQIGLRTVRLRALEGELVSYGNDELLKNRIHNYALQERRRVMTTISLVPQTAAEALAALPGEIERIVAAHPPAVFDRAHLVRFGPASIDLDVVFHTDGAGFDAFMAARHEIILALLRRLAELDIHFAPPAVPAAPAAEPGMVAN